MIPENLEALFSCVRTANPTLALAMIEKHEKPECAKIVRARKCSELEAVYVIVEWIASRH